MGTNEDYVSLLDAASAAHAALDRSIALLGSTTLLYWPDPAPEECYLRARADLLEARSLRAERERMAS